MCRIFNFDLGKGREIVEYESRRYMCERSIRGKENGTDSAYIKLNPKSVNCTRLARFLSLSSRQENSKSRPPPGERDATRVQIGSWPDGNSPRVGKMEIQQCKLGSRENKQTEVSPSVRTWGRRDGGSINVKQLAFLATSSRKFEILCLGLIKKRGKKNEEREGPEYRFASQAKSVLRTCTRRAWEMFAGNQKSSRRKKEQRDKINLKSEASSSRTDESLPVLIKGAGQFDRRAQKLQILWRASKTDVHV